jgi:hypothetical protein
MNYTEFLEIYGENAPLLLGQLSVLHSRYGENTAKLVENVTNLHFQLNNALLFPNPEMVYPEFSTNSFRSKSGAKYIINGQISQKRFKELEKTMLQIDLGQSMSEPSIFLNQLKNAVNAKDLAFAGNLIYQFESGLGCHKRMTELILLCCTLFMILENDTQDWSEASALETMKDWQSIPYVFFLVAFNCFKVCFTETLRAGFQNTLRAQIQIKKPTQSKITSFFKRLKK